MSDFDMKDSGKRENFNTGAVREVTSGKGRYDLLTPCVIEREAKLLEKGAQKYSANNWKKGMSSSRYMESLLRHAFQYLNGDRAEDHLSAIRFNAGGLIYNEEIMPSMDDLTGNSDLDNKEIIK